MAVTKKSILVVDDDRLVQETFRVTLGQEGYRVLVASNGNEALRILADERIDVVLLDIFMPEKDGLESVLEIRRRYPAVLVFAMSGGGYRGKYNYLSVAEKFGAGRVIEKPISTTALIAMIEGYGARSSAVA